MKLRDIHLQGIWLPVFESVPSLIRSLLESDLLFATDVGLFDLNTLSSAIALE